VPTPLNDQWQLPRWESSRRPHRPPSVTAACGAESASSEPFLVAWTHPQVQERQRITEFARSASN
jgi:hypothetical protein